MPSNLGERLFTKLHIGKISPSPLGEIRTSRGFEIGEVTPTTQSSHRIITVPILFSSTLTPSHFTVKYLILLLFFLSISSIMEDYNFGGTEEENAELKKLKAEVVRAVFAL